jgi:cob(I)alamin adenosyltransferase
MTKEKSSVVVIYAGDGKGKTSAALGQVARALGAGQRVAFVQFIKAWEVSEHKFFDKYLDVPEFTFYKGGKGFYHAGTASAKGVSDSEHERAARETYDFALQAAASGDYDLVIADEINTAVASELLTADDLRDLITKRVAKTSLVLTGRGWPSELDDLADIITEMNVKKHYFQDGYTAKEGIEY